MPRAARSCAALAALLTLLAASPARGGFVVYSFTSDSSDRGGSLSGSFRVDEADLLDGVLSTADVRDYAFTFTDPSGGTTQYALSGVFPDIDVDPTTGVPTGVGGFVLGDQVGDSGVAEAALTPQALTPGSSLWVANTRPMDESDGGFGHWQIGPAAAAPAPGGAALGLAGAGCLAAVRLLRPLRRGRD